MITKNWIETQFDVLNEALVNSGVKIIALPFNIEVINVPLDDGYVSVEMFRELRGKSITTKYKKAC